MSEEKKHVPQEETFHEGPMSLLMKAMKANCQVLVSCRNNRKILGRVKAFDRHMNLILEDVTEVWSERPRRKKGAKAKPMNKERFFKKLFLRGDSVILIIKNPK